MPRKLYKKGEPRHPNAGRKKGTPNKFTTVKQAFLDAFEELGGKDFIIKVAKTSKGKAVVIQSMTRLLPNKTEITGEDGGPIKTSMKVSINLVKAKEIKK